jgi:RNA:NAD 2'-phosphotransferase (TPT1/KptA family)
VLRPDGFVVVSALIREIAGKPGGPFLEDDISSATRHDEHARFQMGIKDSVLWVRATQGHSQVGGEALACRREGDG